MAKKSIVELISTSNISDLAKSNMLLSLVVEELRKIKIEFTLETDSRGYIYIKPLNYSAKTISIEIFKRYDGFVSVCCVLDFQSQHLTGVNFSMNSKNWQCPLKEYINKTK